MSLLHTTKRTHIEDTSTNHHHQPVTNMSYISSSFLQLLILPSYTGHHRHIIGHIDYHVGQQNAVRSRQPEWDTGHRFREGRDNKFPAGYHRQHYPRHRCVTLHSSVITAQRGTSACIGITLEEQHHHPRRYHQSPLQTRCSPNTTIRIRYFPFRRFERSWEAGRIEKVNFR